MITINAAPIPNAIVLDANDSLISITSTNGVDHYFRVIIEIDDVLFDEQSWSRKDNFTAEKNLKNLYKAYFESVFNPDFTNGLIQQTHLIKKVSLTIQEKLIDDDSLVQFRVIDDFYIMHNVKSVPFNCYDKIQFLGINPEIMQLHRYGKIAVPFMVYSENESLVVELKKNNGTVIDTQTVASFNGVRVYVYFFDLSEVITDYLYLRLQITVGSETFEKIFRIFEHEKFPVKEIAFLNNFGYWIYVYLDGQLSIDNNLETKTYEELDNTEKVYEINEKQNYAISTGSLVSSEKEIINQIATALESKIFLNAKWISMINATKKINTFKDRNNLYSETLNFSVKENNSISNQNIIAVVNSLRIDSFTNVSGDNYSLAFSSNYQLANLVLEFSTDQNNWANPITLQTLTSPQTIVKSITIDQYLRLKDTNSGVVTFSNILLHEVGDFFICALIQDLDYQIVPVDNTNNIDFWFTFNLSEQLAYPITVELYYRETGASTWQMQSNLMSAPDFNITLNRFSKYDFRLKLINDSNCPVISIDDCPGFDAIGNQGEFVSILWNDTETSEPLQGFDTIIDIFCNYDMNYGIDLDSLAWEGYNSNDNEWIGINLPLDNVVAVYPTLGINKYRLTALNDYGDTVYSNELQYQRTGTIHQTVRSIGVNSAGPNICSSDLITNCKVMTQSTQFTMQAGDFVLNPNETPFNGQGKVFVIASVFAAPSEPSYVCIVQSNGMVSNNPTLCTS